MGWFLSHCRGWQRLRVLYSPGRMRVPAARLCRHTASAQTWCGECCPTLAGQSTGSQWEGTVQTFLCQGSFQVVVSLSFPHKRVWLAQLWVEQRDTCHSVLCDQYAHFDGCNCSMGLCGRRVCTCFGALHHTCNNCGVVCCPMAYPLASGYILSVVTSAAATQIRICSGYVQGVIRDLSGAARVGAVQTCYGLLCWCCIRFGRKRMPTGSLGSVAAPAWRPVMKCCENSGHLQECSLQVHRHYA